MLNNVSIEGRVTKDPQLRRTDNEKSVITTTIACQRNKKDEADFITIVIWGKQAENFAKYVKKGQMISVNGSLRSRTYVSNGVTRYVTEVVANPGGITYIGRKKSTEQQYVAADNQLSQQFSNNQETYGDHSFGQPSYETQIKQDNSYNNNYSSELYSTDGAFKAPW